MSRIFAFLLLFFPLTVWAYYGTSDDNGYTAKYECYSGGPNCDVDVATFVTRACDDTVTTADSQTAIQDALNDTTDGNSDGSIVICADAGDYVSKGKVTVTSAGTSAVRRVFRSTTSNDPWDIVEGSRSKFNGLDVDGSFWIIHQIASIEAIRMGEGGVVTNVIVDRTLVDTSMISSNDNNSLITIQNNVVRTNTLPPGVDGQCIRLDETNFDTYVVNNELYNCGDSVLLQSAGGGSDKFAGVVVENNDMYQTTAMYCDSDGTLNVNGDFSNGENAVDMKSGGSSTKPLRIINNRVWGLKKTDTSCGSTGSDGDAFIMHEDVGAGSITRFVLIQNNIIVDVPFGISFPNGMMSEISVIGNILYDINSNVVAHRALNSGDSRDSEYYLNTVIKVQGTVNGNDGQWGVIGWGDNKDFRCNVVIDGQSTLGTLATGVELNHQVYYDTTHADETTRIDKTLNTRANSTAYVVGDLIRLSSDPVTDCVTGDKAKCNIYAVTYAGTTASSPPTYPTKLNTLIEDGTVWLRTVRTALIWKRKLRTVSGGEEFLIPYARVTPHADEPGYQFCPRSGETNALGERTSIGINDDIAPSGIFATDLRGKSR